jgi:hypothetical protein
MQQHELDPVSLFSGLLLVLIAGGYGLTHTTDLRLHWLLAVPALLILIGATVIITVTRRMKQPDASPGEPGCAEPRPDVQ